MSSRWLVPILAIVLCGALAAIGVRTQAREAASHRRSIAVIPLTNLSRGPQFDWLSAAFAETLDSDAVRTASEDAP